MLVARFSHRSFCRYRLFIHASGPEPRHNFELELFEGFISGALLRAFQVEIVVAPMTGYSRRDRKKGLPFIFDQTYRAGCPNLGSVNGLLSESFRNK